MKFTRMLKHYLINFVLRLAVFIGVFVFYILDKDALIGLATYPIYQGINAMHILWMVFMGIMLSHLFPTEKLSIALLKKEEKKYEEEVGYSEMELLHYIQKMNVRAWQVMLVWLSFNGVIGALYLFKFIGDAELLLCTVFFFLSDYICILFFCPFQTFIMKNRCCVSCRIFDWGHFMMFTPMLFIRNFFSWSLFFTSLIVLIRWEIIYAKHPERFWDGSNKTIQCHNCKDRICQLKLNKVEDRG